MPRHDLGGQWQAWTSTAVADSFYRLDFALEPEFLLSVPGHWQLEPRLATHQGSVFYRTHFDWQPTLTWPVTRLCIGGAFYQTTVWLNGELLGSHDGYFTPMTWEIRPELLQAKDNVLALRVDCPPTGASWRDIIMGVYGEWDCKPDLVNPGGIWGPVTLLETFRGYLQSPQIDTRLTSWNSAQIRVQASFVWRSVAGQVRASLKVYPRNFVGKGVAQDFSLPVQPGTNSLDLRLTLPDPKLWWTWDQGSPNLYDLHLLLTDEQGNEVDRISTHLGVRELAWKNWQLFLNGRRIFLRGVNYGPTSFYPATVGEKDLERDLELIRAANFNMVRVYNHIALPKFYEYCASAGVLVWQDFPLDKRYERNITGMALRQIRAMVGSLRNEPAVCIWSCHNEPYAQPGQERGGASGYGAMFANILRNVRPSWNKDILDPRLQEAVLQLDQSRPVVPHSGVLGLLRGGSATHHYYGWNTKEYRTLTWLSRLFPRIIRLVNEYGAQSIPQGLELLSHLGSWPHIDWKTMAETLLADVDLLQSHVPPCDYDDWDSYIEATQKYQAELVQYYSEYLRLRKHQPCSGAVVFYFADAWPLVSWSLLDWHREPKLAYHVIRRAMEPVQVMIDWPKSYFVPGERWSASIYVVNDYSRPLPVMGLLWQLRMGDKVIMRERGVAEVEADAVSRVGTLTFIVPEELDMDCQLTLELSLTLPNKRIISNEYMINVRP